METKTETKYIVGGVEFTKYEEALTFENIRNRMVSLTYDSLVKLFDEYNGRDVTNSIKGCAYDKEEVMNALASKILRHYSVLKMYGMDIYDEGI